MIPDQPTKSAQTPITRTVIYARVSSKKQVDEGNGLSSQITRCEAHAKTKGYEVLKTFEEEGVSGGMIERPQMQAMLSYLETHSTPSDPVAVIIDDISRLARGIKAHMELRTAIMLAGGALESPTYEFAEDADSELVEYLLATVSQHQRKKNAEQVRNRMKARWMAGYYTANPGMGYKYKEIEGHGKMLVPDEPHATLVRQAFEGVAAGRLRSASEVKRFLERCPDWPRTSTGEVRLQGVINMLRRPIYAGYITIKKAGIHLQPAKHEPLITFEMWQKAQDMLDGTGRSFARQDIRADFPLRGFVCCASCGNALTSGWSKSRSGKKHPYYICQTRTCDLKGKSIRRDDVEGDFTELVQTLRPAPQLFHMAKAMLEDFWNARLEDVKGRTQSLAQQMAALTRKIDTLTERLLATDSPSLINAYEGQIRKIEENRTALKEQSERGIEPQKPFNQMFKAAMIFLANPCIIWKKGSLEQRRLLARLAFPNRLTYDRETGYRTPEIALPFKHLGANMTQNNRMVRMRGLEPPRLSAPEPKSGASTNSATSAPCYYYRKRRYSGGFQKPQDARSSTIMHLGARRVPTNSPQVLLTRSRRGYANAVGFSIGSTARAAGRSER